VLAKKTALSDQGTLRIDCSRIDYDFFLGDKQKYSTISSVTPAKKTKQLEWIKYCLISMAKLRTETFAMTPDSGSRQYPDRRWRVTTMTAWLTQWRKSFYDRSS